jgi:hypothetical protein
MTRRLTQTEQRLLRYFSSIEDESIKEIIIDVLNIEKTNRYSKHFPVQEIRDAIDRVAKLIETQN